MRVYQAYFIAQDGSATPIPQIDGRQETALAACASWRDSACFIVAASVPQTLKRGDVPVVIVDIGGASPTGNAGEAAPHCADAKRPRSTTPHRLGGASKG